MFLIGLDLAWGTRAPTGVAVLDEDGVLLEVGRAHTDEEVLALVAPYAAGPCVVAIDAPIVVTNPTGNRPAEAALNRDFRAFQAGAHPANTGLAVFADGTRAARVVDALDLSLEGDAERRAIEVYPHAAMVALFGLGRTLKYKAKQGRDQAFLREELLRLVTLVEKLVEADPPLRVLGHPGWSGLVTDVLDATTKAALRRAEDPVDAVVCAYVALLAHRAPAALTAYGDPVTGQILSPTLPPDLEPEGRADAARAGVERRLRAAGSVFADLEADLLLAAGPERLEEHLARREAGQPLETVLGWVDFAGVRLVVRPGAFVPRRRTELLVEEAVRRTGPGAVVVDLCCGIGALAAALIVWLDPAEVHAGDLDPAAVALARENLPDSAHVGVADLDAGLPSRLRGGVDLLVANVPYVPSAAVGQLPREARDHEPRHTLDGGADGLDLVRRLLAAAPGWLAPGGHVLVELGRDQVAAALDAASAAGLTARVVADPARGATVLIGTPA